MIEPLLGIVATVAFTLYAIPQTWAIYRTPKLQGYSMTAWIALAVAVTAVLAQLVLSQAWLTASAQTLNAASIYYALVAIWRKG